MIAGAGHIYLVGFMGSGKTTVGAALAKALGVDFVDLDARIEETSGLSVREVFEQRGEPEFRRLEHEALLAGSLGPRAVVATGGGTITFRRNLEVMQASGVTVWLNPSFATIARRIGGRGKSDRPLFRTEGQALALYRERLPAYRQAEIEVTVREGETPDEVAARIALLVGQRA